MTDTAAARVIRAPRGDILSGKGWQQEAALRMLCDNLDPQVAEHPEDPVVYGGTGRAARSWEAFDAIVASLRDLEDEETLLVQSGKPAGIVGTNEWAPRVLIANSNLVGDWANWEYLWELEAAGLIMYGQMTAGSWIYIGTQGILQGTYETFGAVAKKRFGGTLAGTITLTAGVGGMGGAQPLAVTMNEGVAICVDVDESLIDRRIAKRYLDVKATDLDDALTKAIEARNAKQPLSIGLVGNAAEILPALLERDALVNTSSGASWVSIHHGGGVGIDRSIHAGQVCVADGTELAARRLERVLTNDSAMGVIRHVDTGYEHAAEVGTTRGVRIPMMDTAK